MKKINPINSIIGMVVIIAVAVIFTGQGSIEAEFTPYGIKISVSGESSNKMLPPVE